MENAREQNLLKRIRRRLASSRAPVYLEYAVVMPLVILTISTLIEFAAFWDAKIMANHTAWTCARIASVEAGAAKYDKSFKSNRLRTNGMKVTTALLMSTCAMGSLHGTSKEFTRDWFVKFIEEPLKNLKKAFVENFTKGITKTLIENLGKGLPEGFIKKIVKKAIQDIADVFLQPLIEALVDALTTLFDPIFTVLGDLLDNNRLVRQFAYAAGRVEEFKDIITVTERKDMSFTLGGQPPDDRDLRLDLPRCLDKEATFDDWFVTSDASWPPKGQEQRMIDVKIAWPFERAWLFPVLSSAKLSKADAKTLEGRPTAVGRALAYPQPILSNDNLKSEGATAYDPGNTNTPPQVVEEIRNKYVGFMKVAALYYHYQLGDEKVGPYDSKSKSSGSYKGIGQGITGKADKTSYYAANGLVFWMDRAPSNPKNHKDWKKKKPPADYLQSFRNISEKTNETCYFWVGKGFSGGTRLQSLKNFENQVYTNKEWFCWGDTHSHLRIRRPAPDYYQTLLQSNTVRATHLMSPFASETTWGVTEDEYTGEGRAPYDAYRQLCDQATNIFASCARAMIGTWRPDQMEACEQREINVVARFQNVFPEWQKTLLTLVRNCSRELDEAVGFGEKDNPGKDPGTFIDVGMSDEEILADPEKAAEIIEKRLDELRKNVMPAIREVDRTERELRQFGEDFESRLAALVAVRRQNLINFARATGQSILESGAPTDPGMVRATLRQNHAWVGEDPLVVSQKFEALADEYWEKFYANYEAQLALAKLLNCKAGEVAPQPGPDPNPPLPPPDPDPDLPPVPSPNSGSDDDGGGGDSWSHGKDGWTSDGKGDDR